MNDLDSWLHSSVEKARFFLTDLTRKPVPDLVAITAQDKQFVKGVIVKSQRQADVGALWWTICDDVEVGLETGYFDISTVKPVLEPVSVPKERSACLSRDQPRGRLH